MIRQTDQLLDGKDTHSKPGCNAQLNVKALKLPEIFHSESAQARDLRELSDCKIALEVAAMYSLTRVNLRRSSPW